MTVIHPRPPREKSNGARGQTTAKRRGDGVATPALSSGAEGPTIADIWHARDVLRGHVGETPMLHSRTFSAMTGADVYLKAENLQRSGSFKLRGATFKIAQLSEEERQHGVIAASAGNHAQGVAIAAHSLGIPCTIVMPEGAPLAKLTATQGYGATVVLHGKTYDDAYIHARAIQKETGAIFIHAFDDPAVIAGQGTLGLEILTEMPDADVIIVPIGGGGLISGIAIAAKSLCPDAQIIGVQAAGANSTQRSLEAGTLITLPTINTIADGISTKRPGEVTFPIIQRYVDQVVSVNDEETASAILLLLERGKLLVEGAGAVGIAALLKPGLLDVAGKKVVVLLSGGNIDMNLIGRFIEYGLSAQGRILILNTQLVDRPGELLRLLEIIAEMGVNVREVNHRRAIPQMPIQQVEVTMTVETRNRPHAERVLATLHEHGYRVAEVSSCYDDEEGTGG
ncbi:MAG TPA: threonine ammonia-lyase [Ktedonobacterales bacterium]|nr:threonine ammonia-lyase [Ktedonobacterales bacterium]